jgi:16S rRNA (adenine1518-N6/adenine1519-N6)-dimethyltransferase
MKIKKFEKIPKKSLGQNFLEDDEAIRKIIKAGNLHLSDNILEIGPGTGNLTKQLMKSSNRIIAIEKDEDLALDLAKEIGFSFLDLQKKTIARKDHRLKDSNGIISADILKINFPKIIEDNDFYGYKVIANIPYYITGKIIRLLTETKHKPSLAILLIQKEVAEKICAGQGQMSLLSVAVNFYGEPEIIGIVRRDKFYPAPKVDSAILKIRMKKDSQLVCQSQKDIKEFFRLARIGFASPRKTLLNNLSDGLGKNKGEIKKILGKIGIKENSRAQELDLISWKKILDNLDV